MIVVTSLRNRVTNLFLVRIAREKGLALPRVTLEHLIALNREIHALAVAGVPLEQGLVRVAEEFSGPPAEIARRLADRTAAGATLSDAIDAEALPESYRVLVRAGMQSGKLTAALEGFGTTAERMANLWRIALLAALYPLLIAAGAWVLLFFVGNALLPSLDFIGINDRFWLSALRVPGEWAWYLALIGPLVMLLGYFLWWRWSAQAGESNGPNRWQWLRWIPGVKQILDLGSAASFADLLGLLVRNRLPLGEALPLAAAASGMGNISQSAEDVSRQLAEGKPLGAQTEAFRQLPALVRLALLGNDGPEALASDLQHAAASYQLRAENLASRVSFFLPLTITAVVGGSIAGVYAYLMLQPYAVSLREIALWN